MKMEIAQRNLTDFAFTTLSVGDANESNMMASIAKQITQKRVRMGMNQKEYSELLDISQGMLSRYETGAHNFTIKTLARLFGELGISIDLKFDSKDADSVEGLTANDKWNVSARESIDLPEDEAMMEGSEAA